MKKGTKLYGAGDLVQYLLRQQLPATTTAAIRQRQKTDEAFQGHMTDVRAAMRRVANAPECSLEELQMDPGDLLAFLLHQKLPAKTMNAIRRREEMDERFRGRMDEIRAAMRQVADAQKNTSKGLQTWAGKKMDNE